MAQQRGRADEKKAAQAKRDQRRAKSERAKAAAAEARRKAKRKERLTYVVVAVVALALVVGGFFLVRWFTDTSDTAAPPEGASSDFGVVVGDADATHEVVIYEDFLCPACGDLEATLEEPLATAIEEGRARVEYRTLDFLSQYGDYSLRAANAFAAVLDTAGPEAASEFHRTLFADQPAESGPFPGDDTLVDQAVAAGADEATVRPLIEDLGFEGWIADGTEAASQAGVRSTPTVYVDGQQATGQTTQDVARAVLAAIE